MTAPYTPRQRRALLVLAVLGALAAGVECALAAPPVEGSPDWEIMHPYAEWVQKQYAKDGHWCCSAADGRPVDARIDADGHWQAHVTPEHFPDATDHWLTIPDDHVLHQANPMGVPLLWYNQRMDLPYCFAPAAGT